MFGKLLVRYHFSLTVPFKNIIVLEMGKLRLRKFT